MGETKQINIGNQTYCFYNDRIDLKKFDAKLMKIDKKVLVLDSKFNDYSISSKIRQILLHWGQELTEKYFLMKWQINA